MKCRLQFAAFNKKWSHFQKILRFLSPVLDEADSPVPGENGDSDRTVPGKQIIRRTQSVPTERDAAVVAEYQVVHGRRNLKMMARENLERPPFFWGQRISKKYLHFVQPMSSDQEKAM